MISGPGLNTPFILHQRKGRLLVAAGVNRRHEAKAGRLTTSAGQHATTAAELRPLGACSDPEQRWSCGHAAEAEATQALSCTVGAAR